MTRTTRIAASLALALGATALFSAPGCNIVTPAAYILFGPGDIEAEHQLAQVRTVVFVDDRQNLLPRTVLRASIGERVAHDLITEGQIPSAVEPKQAIALTRQKEGNTKPMSISSIGRELDCQQVIYVQVTAFSLTGAGEIDATMTSAGLGVTPTAKVSIKVIDVVNNTRTYPTSDVGGRELMATLREVDPDKLKTVAQRRAIEDQLAARLGDNIAKLFYTHERIEMGEHLGPRSK